MAAWMKGHCFFALPNDKANVYLEDALLGPVLVQRDAKIATHGTQESYHAEPVLGSIHRINLKLKIGGLSFFQQESWQF